MQNHNTQNNICSINGWSHWKVVKFGHNYMPRFRLNLGHLHGAIDLKNWMGNYKRYESILRPNHHI
jgi:hypothetical protein